MLMSTYFLALSNNFLHSTDVNCLYSGKWNFRNIFVNNAWRNIGIYFRETSNVKNYYFNILGGQNVDRNPDCIRRHVATGSHLWDVDIKLADRSLKSVKYVFILFLTKLVKQKSFYCIDNPWLGLTLVCLFIISQ